MKSKVLILINNAYETNSSDFIEIIQMFLLNDIKVHLVIAKAESQLDDFYKKKGIEIEILSSHSNERDSLTFLKNIVRNNKIICNVCCYLLALAQNIIFKYKYEDAPDKERFAVRTFLTQEMLQYVPKEEYDYIWVHDEIGLIWAQNVKKEHQIKWPIIHHCIELYWEHFLLQKRRKIVYYNQYILFEHAREALKNVDLVVIQDGARWNVLCEYTGISEKRHVFFPVSLYDYVLNKEESTAESKIIYYPTMIAAKRGCIELIEMFENVKTVGFELEIHGIHADPGYMKQLSKLKLSDNVILSNCAMSYSDLLDKHRQIWCVFIYYGEEDNNDKYVVNSSNKIAMALQAGKPIIAIGNHLISELCKEYGCGIALEKWDADEFRQAVSELDKDYTAFCQRAKKCYEERYNASKFYANILDGMMEVNCD